MVSPNVSNESPLASSEKSLDKFIDLQMKGNLVIKDKMSSYKSESSCQDTMLMKNAPQVSVDRSLSSVAAGDKSAEFLMPENNAKNNKNKPRSAKQLDKRDTAEGDNHLQEQADQNSPLKGKENPYEVS